MLDDNETWSLNVSNTLYLDARLYVELARCHYALYSISMFSYATVCFCHFLKRFGRICTNVLSTSNAPKLWLPFLAQYLCVMYNIFTLLLRIMIISCRSGGLVSPERLCVLALDKNRALLETSQCYRFTCRYEALLSRGDRSNALYW